MSTRLPRMLVVGISRLRSLQLLGLIVVISCSHGVSFAQYRIHQWASFENAVFPPKYKPLSVHFQETVRMVDLSLVPNAPANFRSPIAARETGRFGLILKSNPEVRVTGISTDVILQRDLLGENGKALYQADFFLPPPRYTAPSLAVLAMEPPGIDDIRPKSFYRFGITKDRDLYFSMISAEQEGTARVYKRDTEFFNKLPRPGWRRFSIVFDGPSKIHCYVDGQEPSFSPVEDEELRDLQVGIMLADPDNSYLCYVDNLSIQWTTEDVPLPDSPYIGDWGKAAEASSSAATHEDAQDVSSQQSTGVQWLDVAAGRLRAQANNQKILVYFQAPRVRGTRLLNEMIANTPEAVQYISQYIPVKVDVNQLQGGTMAENYEITRVPTLMLLTPQGEPISRAVFSGFENWADLAQKLETGSN